MAPADLRAWQARMGYTYATAAQALGVSRAAYARWVAGLTPISKTTALACAAIFEGVEPWPKP